MSVKFLFVIFGGIVLTLVDNARTLPRVKRQSLKVRITAKDDSIIIKYLSSNPAIRLQGYILGYGGRQSKQNITLPDNGDPFEVDVEFNPRYLIAVHPVAEQSKPALKKKCKGNLNHQKPPQITISTRTATSVFLTWTNGIKGNVYKHGGHDCGDERHYTVRYREKERDKKWLYQCCPTSATTIDNLKPNTVYEFGVRVSKAKEEGTWSEPTNYITAVTSSPTNTENGQTQKISKKLAINFGNENGKNSRIAELPGETNIIGIKDKKGPAASYPAQNGTNWIRFPKKPTVNTQVVLGGQSASDSARDHSTSSSSPKPNIPHKPEHAPDQLHGKEGRNKLKSKETSNTVTKPSLKSGKMRNAKEKSKVKPLTTKESKLPSSVSPSFPSKPVPKSDPAEIQIPVFLTPSPPSHLDTTDKQQPTEPVTTPPSTTLPFTILSTTSGHTAVDKQNLPGTTSVLDPMETQKFSEPEIPSSSRGSFHPTSDPDAMNNQEFKDYGFSTSDTAIMPSPSPIYETGEKELAGLKLPTSEISHEFIPTSVSELDLDKKFTDNKLTHPDSSQVFIPTLGNIEDTEFTVRKLPKSDTPRKFSSTPVSELDNKEDEEFTEHKLPTSGIPDVLIQSQESTLDKIEDKDFTEYLFPTSDTPHVRSSTSVQPPFDSNGKMLTESDPPSDRSPVITSKRVQEPDTMQKFTELETQSPGGHLSSTVPGNTQESSPVFRSTPVSNIDGQGQERFRGSYVKYLTKQDRPCSITESLKHFPHENITNNKATAPPRYPPSNLTLVTVEGCPTFLIVDWESNENDTASEYEVVSTMQGLDNKTEELITVTNQTHAAVENLKPNTSYTFSVTATNIHGKGPSSVQRSFVTESADPSVSEYVPGKDAIWTQYSFKFDSYSECQGKQFVKRTRYRKFVGIILCNSLRYKIYLSNSLSGIFYNIGDLSGHGEDHCQFVDSFLDGRTGEHLLPEQLPIRQGFYRSVRQEPVMFGTIGGRTHINYVHWYECGIAIPGQW